MRGLLGWFRCEFFDRHDPVLERVPMGWGYDGEVWLEKSYGRWMCRRCQRSTNERGR